MSIEELEESSIRISNSIKCYMDQYYYFIPFGRVGLVKNFC
ncbi:10225_t:CDS:2 [Racocetra fulgida]|uniref:10225_t:CDS:1 n=1 Tax=Racocetra fulgida TaxID=60492 RepID=A0A9N9A1D9_9GLOM|nr:10225_t:CDS:2 [Racocetra fulgida]